MTYRNLYDLVTSKSSSSCSLFKRPKKAKIWTVSWMFPDFPFQIPEGFQRVGRSMVRGIVVQQQDALWQSPSIGWTVGFIPFWSMSQWVALMTVVQRSRLVSKTGLWESQKMVNTNLPAGGCVLNFVATGDDGCFHCMLFRFVSGWQRWVQVSSPVTIRCRELSPSSQ